MALDFDEYNQKWSNLASSLPSDYDYYNAALVSANSVPGVVNSGSI